MNEDILKIRKRELNKFKKIFANMPEDKKKINDSLFERAVFMREKLKDMEQRIDADGVIVEMPQGNYKIERAHPLISQYNAMVKNYSAVIKQLCEQLPPTDADRVGETLLAFATKKPTRK
jgi:deoxyadenosine/deoxycytidine kinase